MPLLTYSSQSLPNLCLFILGKNKKTKQNICLPSWFVQMALLPMTHDFKDKASGFAAETSAHLS